MERDALIAHRRRMGMIPASEMPPTRDEDCGCGGKVARASREPAYKPRGVKNPRFAHLKVK